MAQNVIYKIRNLINDKFYVGSAMDTRSRFRQHRKLLRRGTHHCKHLQAAWNKYGEDRFCFEVVEQCSAADQLEPAEDRWLVEHVGKPHCYNSGRSSKAPWRGTKGMGIAPMSGKNLTDGAKQQLREATLEQWKISDPRTGRTHSVESKAKISEKMQQVIAEGRGGKFIPSEETRAKMSASLKGNQNAKGHERTEEHRRKLAEANKGNQNWSGRTHSEESRIKMGKAVIAVGPDGVEHAYPTITMLRTAMGLPPPTVHRALDSGQPLTKGKYKGWSFRRA
jgi:group I intron endonuclease